ncbi:MAG: coproporphyrinogen dehydrogenase HemZ, partial [Christensenellaceae bacterium]|nr:coproporphyrinogen dehydrogenase HemZ [Christensenellaceae bacterium]
IPFCNTRCVYCSFPGETIKSDLFVDDYLNALIFELNQVKKISIKNNLKLRCVYIGGGTPTSINQFQLNKIITSFLEIFPETLNGMEFTVEAGRPDSISIEKLKVLSKFGVNRISINPQTMLDKTLKIIGRHHTTKQTINAFYLARECSFNNINMDTIMGLPGEGFEDFKFTMDEIFKLNPEGLTIHSLAIKKGSKLALSDSALTDGDTIQRMVDYGDYTASKLNMSPYYLYRQKYMSGHQQNIAYSKIGKECLYNVDIMEENVNIIAVGAGAISKRIFYDKNKRIERAPNVSNVSIYIDRISEMINRKIELFNNK